ncbi:MAG TPA: hypothetical protein VKB58_08050 [Terriglobales bacterium]|nr:hypothetical protein [Terriglobales bacterium]
MAPVVRYRYVDFGTVFTGDPRTRSVDAASESPGTLFANELAVDVGGTCWGPNEPLVVLDHRASATQFPSATAAVLHKANRIRERFTQSTFEVIWLVTHQEPDFDAFCSMYLARWIIESPDAALDWQSYGLNPDGWLDLADKPKIDWFHLDLNRVPKEHRWPMLLAAYASYLDGRRPISCPRQRALHSILWAAMKCGRDYLNESSGATEFFDEVRSCLLADELNPIFDSVLEGSTRFAPELAMLDREADLYPRDVQRARRSIVFLPEAEAPSAQFFKTPKEVLLQELEGRPQEVNAEDLLLADTFRIPTDAIYLRDPECLLFEEWARLEIEDSALGAGFEFTAIAISGGRPDGAVNKSNYVFSIAPDRAKGRHLYTVWSRLQTKEVEARRTQQQSEPMAELQPREASAAAELVRADPWIGGQSSFGTLVRAPRRGTVIGPPGERNDLRDDPIVEEVRTELENAIYAAQSLVDGPQVTVVDFSSAPERDNRPPQQFDLNSPLQSAPPSEGYFRYAAVRLRADVQVLATTPAPLGLAKQIAETLWQVLYPEEPGAMPGDFAERHVHIAPDRVAVWSHRGIAIAQKSPLAESKDRDQFAAVMSLVREIARLREAVAARPSDVGKRTTAREDYGALKSAVADGEALRLRAAEIKHALTLPGNELLRSFSGEIGFEQLIAGLYELNQTAGENLRRREEAEARSRDERLRHAAKLHTRLRWLQAFSIGLLVILVVDMMTATRELSSTAQRALSVFAGPTAVGLCAWMLKLRKPKPQLDKVNSAASSALLAVVIVAAFLAWLVGLLHIWSK